MGPSLTPRDAPTAGHGHCHFPMPGDASSSSRPEGPCRFFQEAHRPCPLLGHSHPVTAVVRWEQRKLITGDRSGLNQTLLVPHQLHELPPPSLWLPPLPLFFLLSIAIFTSFLHLEAHSPSPAPCSDLSSTERLPLCEKVSTIPLCYSLPLYHDLFFFRAVLIS